MAHPRQQFIDALKKGETVTFKGQGNSMTPMLKTGDMLRVEPIADYSTVRKGDAVFCKVRKSIFVHKVYAIDKRDGKLFFQIGNNHGHINGWTSQDNLFGLLTGVNVV